MNLTNKYVFKMKEVLENHLIHYPTPKNLFYVFGFGSLLGIMLVVQVATGVLLAMHYAPYIEVAFDSVERIMREVPVGWLLRYLHSNGSSMLFVLLYCHIARGLYYYSYKKPKQWVWCSGVILFILMAGISFLGYTLPWGQMSFWGATVITNLLSAIPLVGSKIVVWVWGGFAINANTLNRFFSLHYFLSIIVLVLSLLHLVLLHKVGSTTPEKGGAADFEYSRFFPYFVVKDLVTLLVFFVILLGVVFYAPNMFGHPDNYIRASALVTPAHIVPEWYFLPFYAMLKSVPSKLGGAFFMVASMLILLILPWVDKFGVVAEPKFKPGFVAIFILFLVNMLLLGWLGGKPVSETITPAMQLCTVLYFSYFIVIMPLYAYFEWWAAQRINAAAY
jgi:ubiquinol-cytochrome c reductase cytochrome b subunit